MTAAAKTENAEKATPSAEDRYGHDELNFAEFPLVVLADRAPTGVKTIHYQDEYEDPRTGKRVPRKVTITGSDEHGLPTAKDDEVLVGLLYLTKQTNNFADAVVHFNRRDFLRILGWPDEGRYYHRLSESLYRWLGVTVRYDNCWWDADKERYGTEAFHLLDNVSIYDERHRSRPEGPGQFFLPLSSFRWNAIPFKSFRQDYLKELDLEQFLRLPGAAAKRAYRFLDKSLPAAGPVAYDLRLFACEKVGMSRNYKPSRLITEVQATVVDPLEKAHFLAPLDPKERFVKEARGRYRVVLARAAQQMPASLAGDNTSEPLAAADTSAIESELKQRGLGGKAARDLIAAHPADHIRQKIDYLDFLIERGEQPKKPAGWLRAAIEHDYGPPAGYLQREERLRQQQAAEQKHRRQDEEQALRRRREEQEAAARKAQRAHIDAYLNALTPQERKSLEEQAITHADDHMREAALGGNALAEIARRALVDQEVLRVHPLTAPESAS
ncbi:MAG TPA: replication initiator protein A [Gemmataceae bacterium]|nr:replication initiator protein A [Gemmataceae bacterium]